MSIFQNPITAYIKREAAKAAARQMRSNERCGAVGCEKCGFPHVDMHRNDTFTGQRHTCK